jgi:cellobiose-specific phosphotransferase system component IIB
MVVCIAGTSASIFAQKHTPLPHGMVFGNAPSNINQMPANRLETFMGKRTRTSVVITCSGTSISLCTGDGNMGPAGLG